MPDADAMGWTPGTPPYGPGAICGECGHFAYRHGVRCCSFPRPTDNPCTCRGLLWLNVRWDIVDNAPVRSAVPA